MQVTVGMVMFAMLLKGVLFLFLLEARAQEMVRQAAACLQSSAIIECPSNSFSVPPRRTAMLAPDAKPCNL